MAIVRPGEKLPATYLERFDPAENVIYRISVLSTDAIATEHHWVDVPSKDIKGVYQCIQGACCHAMGRRMQNYSVPIYVYRQAGSVEGDIYVLQMTPSRWKKFSDLALQLQGGLLQYDLTFTASKRGQGMDWSYSILPDAKYRDYWSPEQREQLNIAVQSFYQMGESSLVTPMSFNDWNQLLYDIGYDVVNQCWPGGQSPMNAGKSFGAISKAVGVGSILPPPPPAGFVPTQPHVPNIANGVIMQPSAPMSPQAAIPTMPVSMGIPPSNGMQTSPPVPTSAPAVPPGQGFHNVTGYGVPQQPNLQQAPQSMGVPNGYVAATPAVPLGTAPVMPQQPAAQPSMATPAAVMPQSVSQGVVAPSTVPVMQNTVPTEKLEITADELNRMLD